jgi:hypothetical protein
MTHTQVPEAPYQIEMWADKELRESSQGHASDSKQTAARQNVAIDSSEQWGDLPSFLLGRSHHDPVPTAYLSRSFPLYRVY